MKMDYEMVDRPTIRIPGNGFEFQLFDAMVTCTVVGDDTGGAYSVFEQRLPVGGVMPPCRTAAYEMACYELEGTALIGLGGQSVVAEPGTIVRIPKGTTFSFRTVGAEAVRFLSVVTPGGLEGVFESWWEMSTDEMRDRRRIAGVLASFGIEVLEEERTVAAASRANRPRRVEYPLCASMS